MLNDFGEAERLLCGLLYYFSGTSVGKRNDAIEAPIFSLIGDAFESDSIKFRFNNSAVTLDAVLSFMSMIWAISPLLHSPLSSKY